MRAIGVAERALELMIDRAAGRVAFGSPLIDKGVVQDMIAESRIGIDMRSSSTTPPTRWIPSATSRRRRRSARIKVAVPRIVLEVIDRAIQVHGAAGVTQFTPLASMWAHARTLRIVDAPTTSTDADRPPQIKRRHPG